MFYKLLYVSWENGHLKLYEHSVKCSSLCIKAFKLRQQLTFSNMKNLLLRPYLKDSLYLFINCILRDTCFVEGQYRFSNVKGGISDATILFWILEYVVH